MSSSQPKYKHDLEIEVRLGIFKKIATLYSFEDCPGNISNPLRIGLDKYCKDWGLVRLLPSFKLTCKQDALVCEYMKFMKYLNDRDKAAVVYLNKSKKKGYLAPAGNPISSSSQCIMYYDFGSQLESFIPRSPEVPFPRSPEGPPPPIYSMPTSPEGPPPRSLEKLPLPAPRSSRVLGNSLPLPKTTRSISSTPFLRSPEKSALPLPKPSVSFAPRSPEAIADVPGHNDVASPDRSPPHDYDYATSLPTVGVSGLSFEEMLAAKAKGESFISLAKKHQAQQEKEMASSSLNEDAPGENKAAQAEPSLGETNSALPRPLPKAVGGVKRSFDKIGTGISWSNDSSTDQGVTAQKYDGLIRTREDRASAAIYHLRNFNNWVKASLIKSLYDIKAMKTDQEEEYLDDLPITGIAVLDLGCGKGGDIRKWVTHELGIVRYVGVDIAQKSLEDFIERIQSNSSIPEAAIRLGWADPGKLLLGQDAVQVWESKSGWTMAPVLQQGDAFDAVSCQFALHYFFENEARLRRFFENASAFLQPGGHFVTTTVDARVLVELLMGHAIENAEDGSARVDILDKDFGNNSVCTIIFDKACKERLLKRQVKDETGTDWSEDFGLRYWFTLYDHPELGKDGKQQAVDAPEWIVPLPLLQRIAADYDLEVINAQNFHEFAAERMRNPSFTRILYHMKVLNQNGSLSETEWKLARLYMVIHMRKKKSENWLGAKAKLRSKKLGKEDKEKTMRLAEEVLKRELSEQVWEQLPRDQRENLLKKQHEKMIGKKAAVNKDLQLQNKLPEPIANNFESIPTEAYSYPAYLPSNYVHSLF